MKPAHDEAVDIQRPLLKQMSSFRQHALTSALGSHGRRLSSSCPNRLKQVLLSADTMLADTTIARATAVSEGAMLDSEGRNAVGCDRGVVKGVGHRLQGRAEGWYL